MFQGRNQLKTCMRPKIYDNYVRGDESAHPKTTQTRLRPQFTHQFGLDTRVARADAPWVPTRGLCSSLSLCKSRYPGVDDEESESVEVLVLACAAKLCCSLETCVMRCDSTIWGYGWPGNTHQQLSDAVAKMASAKGECADVVAAAFVESFNDS